MDESCIAQAGQGMTQRRVGRHKYGLELVDRLSAGLDRRGLSHLEHPQHLHRAVTSLGAVTGPAGQYRPGSGFGVDRVGLAASPAGGLVRLADLDHLQPCRVQVPGQRRTVGAGALHSRVPHRPETAHPGHQRPITCRGGRERPAGHQRTQRSDHCGDVLVFVGIHPHHNLANAGGVLVVVNRLRHAGHGPSLSDRTEIRMAIAGPAWAVRTVTVPC